MEQHPEILNSWKEIAVYLGRGIRTVQRWERELQLPIRRPRKNARTAVMAFRGELDEWLSRVPASELWRETADPTVQLPFLEQRSQQLLAELQFVQEKIRQIKSAAQSAMTGRSPDHKREAAA